MTSTIIPHGKELVQLVLPERHAKKLLTESLQCPSWTLTNRQLCDVELLLNGAFSPLKKFMNQLDYISVVNNMRLANGLLWPIPIVLDVPEDFAKTIKLGQSLLLRDPEGLILAVMHIDDIWQPDKLKEAQLVYGTDNYHHAGVAYLKRKVHDFYLGGELSGISLPHHYDFAEFRQTPEEVRAYNPADS